MFDLIRDRCEEKDVEVRFTFDELTDEVSVCFRKGEWQNMIRVNMYLSLDIIMQRINDRLVEFLEDVRRSEGEVDDVS